VLVVDVGGVVGCCCCVGPLSPAKYRSDDPSGYQPPPSVAPLFHDNIVAEDCGNQLAWLEGVLAGVDEADWLIVAGHHPLEQVSSTSSFLNTAPPPSFVLECLHTLPYFSSSSALYLALILRSFSCALF